MSFSTDTKWPQGLLDIFENHRNQKYKPLESFYFGPYIKLLNYAIVEDSFTFFITPQTTYDESYPFNNIHSSFATFLVVMNQEHKPVLFVEIKAGGWVNSASCRLNADAQMRRRYNEILYECPIPRLYGLSLLGTSLRVYCTDKATSKITPPFVHDPGKIAPPFEHRPGVDILPSNYLQGQWDLDILSPDGLMKMQEIIGYIKAEVEAASSGV
ncbi:hypothetical protein DFH94DRAFT_845041 [Russula ochroleuca]|jgi:hypothetical protein|uniref:Uncharacterized protein n=1 Tax=Russula ochroleuca TaxID=152965 RepID=A0A9P5T9T9_9AGAM|nr:hypothetical protein DFH94DRAFT_845041 [Russula ochroleuca]